jgi:endogenous inhibitor of DNA gyrase (YacG/DUF329 family)
MTQPQKKCPICRKPRVAEHAPFCSSQCRYRDLLKWLDDGYSLPGPAAPPENPPDD